MSAPTITAPATAGGGVPVGGSGAAGYVAKWTAATTLGGSTTTGATASLYIDSAVGRVSVGGTTFFNSTAVLSQVVGTSSAYFGAWKTTATSGGSVFGCGTNPFEIYSATGTLGSDTYTLRTYIDTSGNFLLNPATANVVFSASTSGQGIKLATTPGNTDPNTLDCYAETDVSSGYTLSGVTATSGAITVAIRATRIGRTMTFAVSIAPAGGASLTFAAAWYLTMTGVSAPAFAGSLAVSSNDATVTRGTAWVNAVAGPTVYGSAAVLGANVSLFLNGTI